MDQPDLPLVWLPRQTAVPKWNPAVGRCCSRKSLHGSRGSTGLGHQGIQLDARLALAEIEMKAGQLAAGRAHLVVIEADAKANGYNLVARKAAIARA
jgi:hypothetical protein